MGKESRVREAAAMELMLSKEHVPTVAGLSLIEAVLNHVQRLDLNQYQREQCEGIMKRLVRLHDSFRGRVEDSLIAKCDRYLCRCQDAMDGFFDDLTPEDLAGMEATKARWPQHKEAEPCSQQETL